MSEVEKQIYSFWVQKYYNALIRIAFRYGKKQFFNFEEDDAYDLAHSALMKMSRTDIKIDSSISEEFVHNKLKRYYTVAVMNIIKDRVRKIVRRKEAQSMWSAQGLVGTEDDAGEVVSAPSSGGYAWDLTLVRAQRENLGEIGKVSQFLTNLVAFEVIETISQENVIIAKFIKLYREDITSVEELARITKFNPSSVVVIKETIIKRANSEIEDSLYLDMVVYE